jgi:ABC-2 type transport system ATP-binding protein
MISAKNLGKRYGQVRAVQDVSLDIQRGEVVGLLGQNGAGKTTIMKMITGFTEPTEGTVTVDGIDVLADRVGVQRRIGYLPENAPLYPEQQVQDYLLWMAALRGIPEERQAAAVVRAARATGLEGHMLRPIGQLSKGYRQRVGIAQAIVHQPEVLIFDEPTNGLDPVQIESIRELIRSLAQTSTVLISTHILQEVEAVCDRVLVLIDGRLVADGPLDSLRSSRVVLLSVAEGTDGVPRRLASVDGVVEVLRRGPDDSLPGFDRWAVHYDTEQPPTPAIVRAAVEAGWTVGAVAPERVSLQAAFQRLQAEVAMEQRTVASLAQQEVQP